MKILLPLAAALLLNAASQPAFAQNTPRGEARQARADRKMDRAHTIRHGKSLTKEPKLVRREDHLDHRADKHKFKL
ncbi:hypothetical protein A0257_07300 [Hymenobacter psoromatis]|nr:hypothetical protein A0257_07300 [Hymenobacter psoromatis]